MSSAAANAMLCSLLMSGAGCFPADDADLLPPFAGDGATDTGSVEQAITGADVIVDSNAHPSWPEVVAEDG